MGETRIDGPSRRERVDEPDPPADRASPKPVDDSSAAAAAARADRWIAADANAAAAVDANWAALQKAPPPTLSAIPDPSCARRLTGPKDAATLAARGVPLGLALQQTAIVSVPELEKLIDAYVAFTASRPELKGLHDDAVRRGPEIFARRLDQEEAESRVAEAHQRMADTAQHLVVRPPLVIAQRAAVGEVAIPVAKVVDTLVKLTPIAGELLATLEIVTELVQNLPRTERVAWKDVPLPVVVHVHPSVLQSDEAIVGVLQHEAYELGRLSATLKTRTLGREQIATMVDGKGVSNIHGQAWDVADLRVMIMRESDPARKVALHERLKTMVAKFDRMLDQ